jgi:hypothetical protein
VWHGSCIRRLSQEPGIREIATGSPTDPHFSGAVSLLRQQGKTRMEFRLLELAWAVARTRAQSLCGALPS